MSNLLIISVFFVYTAFLFFISWLTSKKNDNNVYFKGNKKSPWLVVAIGMIGSSLSGVTLISVPGNVYQQSFFYMPMVLGFVVGYLVIIFLLLPLYYKMNLTSIYTYLETRFGTYSYKIGALFFALSRVLGAVVRIYLVILVLYNILPSHSFSFPMIAFVFILLIFLYTFRGGIKTIIWTDVLQTFCMILAVVIVVVGICSKMNWNMSDMIINISKSDYSKWLDMNSKSSTYFVKQFISGIFVTLAMSGVDQEMMQKNLSCKNLKQAQKNIFVTSISIFFVTLLFLVLGAIFAIFIQQQGGLQALGIDKTDAIFSTITIQYLSPIAGIFLLIGLVSASYPSAAGALTSLTTSYCMDFLHFDKRIDLTEKQKINIRYKVHAFYAILFFLLTLVFYWWNNQAVITLVYQLATYTYGPLLGFFLFGILTSYKIKDKWIPLIAISSPLLCMLLNYFCKTFYNFDFGFSLLIVNTFFTFLGMWVIRK